MSCSRTEHSGSAIEKPCKLDSHCIYLTHLCPMDFPISINWKSSLPILELLGGISHFHPNFNRTFCRQTVKNLIRRHILRRLIWFCTVCRCPTKRVLGLYGLIKLLYLYFNMYIKPIENLVTNITSELKKLPKHWFPILNP